MCAICAEREKHRRVRLDDGRLLAVCDECHQPIPPYEAMGGSGFESHTVDHTHTEQLGNVTVQVPVMLQLCHACYLKDHQKVYPNSPLPVIANVRGFVKATEYSTDNVPLMVS